MIRRPPRSTPGTRRRQRQMCIRDRYGVPVTPTYKVTDIMDKDQTKDIEYPVVTKPTDNNGSTGITICNDEKSLIKGYNFAKKSSKKGEVLIEKKMEFEHSLIAHYTAQNGKVIFCGLTDKESKKINKNSAPVMSIQFMPSLSLIHISEPTRQCCTSRMPSSA